MHDSQLEDRPRVSVVVPVYNAEKTLPECLDSLMELNFDREKMEIIVVDNNSTDSTKEIILKYPVKYLFEPNRGRAWARNRGVKYAKADFIAFIDADCIATNNWLAVFLQRFSRDTNVVICGGEVVPFRQDTIFEKYVATENLLCQKFAIKGCKKGDIPCVITANAIFRKYVLEEVGYFDEDLVTSEDTELSWRIYFLGYKIQYIPEAVVYHQYIRTFWKFCQHYFEYGVAAAVVDQKYTSLGYKCERKQPVLSSVFYLIKSFLIAVYSLVQSVLSQIGKKEMWFIYTDIVKKTSHLFGTFVSKAKIIFNNGHAKGYKGVASENILEQFSVYNHSMRWSLKMPLRWFIQKGCIRLIVPAKGFQRYNFNRTGTDVWLSLLRTGNLQQTIDEIAALYNIPKDMVAKDVNDFMSILMEEGILKKD